MQLLSPNYTCLNDTIRENRETATTRHRSRTKPHAHMLASSEHAADRLKSVSIKRDSKKYVCLCFSNCFAGRSITSCWLQQSTAALVVAPAPAARCDSLLFFSVEFPLYAFAIHEFLSAPKGSYLRLEARFLPKHIYAAVVCIVNAACSVHEESY